MGRITATRPVTRIALGTDGEPSARRRGDVLAVEEPLEIRVGGAPLAVTMRTPGHDVELAAGYLVSEGVIAASGDLARAIHCAGPSASSGTGDGSGTGVGPETDGGNTYNVLDVTLARGIPNPVPNRTQTMTSACGICGKSSIDDVRAVSRFDVASDASGVDASFLATLPELLRAHQSVFDKTGGLHAAGLVDLATGDLLVTREDVGRHNAVDKVIGWALHRDLLPLRGVVLQVSGRASFELVQKAVMAGIPILSAVSAPSSLAVELAEDAGLTLAAFVRRTSLNLYSRPDRVRVGATRRAAGA